MYWKSDGTLSSAAFLDKNGLSVERAGKRSNNAVVNKMKKTFVGSIFSVTVKICRDVNAVVKYRPTRNKYHSEIHGGAQSVVLTPMQRRYLAKKARKEN